jgi:hypothetical protein
MSTPRTKTVSTEVSSDVEWIWRASAEVVLPTAVAAGARRPDSSAGWQPQARSAAPYQDMTVSHCSSRKVTILASWRGHQVRPSGQITRHLAQARAALQPAPPPPAAPKDRKPPRAPPGRAARRRGSGPHRRCGQCPQYRSVGHRYLLAETRDQRGPVAPPHDQRAGGQVESVVWSPTRSASVMAEIARKVGSGC